VHPVPRLRVIVQWNLPFTVLVFYDLGSSEREGDPAQYVHPDASVHLCLDAKLFINEVGPATAFGVLMGPHVTDAINPHSWGRDTNAITREVMRIVLAISLFAIGIELPQAYMATNAKGLIAMVVPTMAMGWVIVAGKDFYHMIATWSHSIQGIIYGLFPPLTFVASLAIAACLTPTDPVICATILGGKYAKDHVPEKLRNILSAESAANDGMAYPFLTLSLYLILDSSWRAAIKDWILIGCLYQVVLGVIIGAMLGIDIDHFHTILGHLAAFSGYMFSRLMKYFSKRGFIVRESYITQYIALALFVMGIANTLGSDDLLAAFAAGCAIAWDGDFKIQVEGDAFWPVIDLALNSACFVYLGAWLPFEAFNNPAVGITPWRLVVLLLAILSLRRIPPLLMLYKWIPEIDTWREALFSGHFGPVSDCHGRSENEKSDLQVQMGVSAIFVSCLALQKLPSPHDPPENDVERLAATLQPIVSFVVLGSIIIHGISPPLFSLVKRVHSQILPLNYTWSSYSVRQVQDLSFPKSTPDVITARDDQSSATQSTSTLHSGDR